MTWNIVTQYALRPKGSGNLLISSTTILRDNLNNHEHDAAQRAEGLRAAKLRSHASELSERWEETPNFLSGEGATAKTVPITAHNVHGAKKHQCLSSSSVDAICLNRCN
ncbi:hypothetical protein B7463_g11883, partial [Scytalidium lignicola]